MNSQRALRLEPTENNSVNVIGGWEGNQVGPEVVGATIGGGGAGDLVGTAHTNRVLGSFGTVGGGLNNSANGSYSTVSGGAQNVTAGQYAAVGGGMGNFTIGYAATVGGGQNNSANDVAATVGGGVQNTSGNPSATVAGGQSNTAGALNATVGGGAENTASEFHATVGGGLQNSAGGRSSVVGGGWNNTAIGFHATVGGGLTNTASGNYSTVPGGWSNSATHYGFAAGRRAKANHVGAFVWGDSNDADITSTANNSVTFRASGGYRLFSHSTATAGVSLANGGTSWGVISDRNVKKDFTPVDSLKVLEKLAVLPITQWRYDWETDDHTPHLGPVAQDFKAAFYPGADDKVITTQEADGVALAAIQGLNEKVEAKSQESGARLQKLEAENQDLRKELSELKRLVEQRLGLTTAVATGAIAAQ